MTSSPSFHPSEPVSKSGKRKAVYFYLYCFVYYILPKKFSSVILESHLSFAHFADLTGKRQSYITISYFKENIKFDIKG